MLVDVFARRQVSEERQLGITPLLHMDAKDEAMQCSLEINFIDCVVTPLWERMVANFPSLEPCIRQLRANRAAYSALSKCTNDEIAQVPCQALLVDKMWLVEEGPELRYPELDQASKQLSRPLPSR